MGKCGLELDSQGFDVEAVASVKPAEKSDPALDLFYHA
jgi:hypothetical protein